MNGATSRIYSIALDSLFLALCGKDKKGADCDTEVSRLPGPCSISSSLISSFLCHPDGLVSNGFWGEPHVLAHSAGSLQLAAGTMHKELCKEVSQASGPWQGEVAALLLLRKCIQNCHERSLICPLTQPTSKQGGDFPNGCS